MSDSAYKERIRELEAEVTKLKQQLRASRYSTREPASKAISVKAKAYPSEVFDVNKELGKVFTLVGVKYNADTKLMSVLFEPFTGSTVQ